MDAEALRAMVAQNRELEPQLTKRNQQYIFDLKKSLEAANLSEAEMATALNEILPVLVKEQKAGKPRANYLGRFQNGQKLFWPSQNLKKKPNHF